MTFTRFCTLSAAGIAVLALAFFATAGWQLSIYDRAQRDSVYAQVRAHQDQLQAWRSSDLRLRAKLLAENAAFSAYVADAIASSGLPGASVDTASINDLLSERREQLELDWLGVLDVSGTWIAGTRPWSSVDAAIANNPLYVSAHASSEIVHRVQYDAGRWFLAAIAPLIRAGVTEAYLLAAIELDQAFIDALSAGAPARLVLAMRSGESESSGIFPADSSFESNLAPVLRTDALPAGNGRVLLADGREAQVSPLFGDEGGPVLVAVIDPPAGSRQALVRPLIGLAAIVLAVLALALWVLWRRVFARIAIACDLLERTAQGDYRLRAPNWYGGFNGRFAFAFEAISARLRPPPPDR